MYHIGSRMTVGRKQLWMVEVEEYDQEVGEKCQQLELVLGGKEVLVVETVD